MGNQSCRKCFATRNAWWHKAAEEKNPPILHPKVHEFEGESNAEFMARMKRTRTEGAP